MQFQDSDNPVLFSKVESGIDSQNQYENLFMQAHVGIVIFKGEELVIHLVNANLLSIWGKDASVIGKPFLEAVPEIIGTAYPQLLLEVLHTGITHYANENSAYLIRDGKEELVYFNFVYQPLYEPDGSISGVMVTANEVTDQIVARKKVEESEKRFRNLVLNADVATAIYMGEEMIIQLANDAMLKVWGKDASVIGMPLRQALPELEGQPFYNLLQQVYTTGNTYKATEDRADLVVDGKLQSFFFNFSYKALRNETGAVYAILNMAVDVTEQVLAKQKLEESEERLRIAVEERTKELKDTNENLIRSNQELEQFAHVASHDLKEPIRKVKLFSNRLQHEFEDQLPANAKVYLQKVQTAADRMMMMVEGVLNYSMVNASRQHVKDVDLHALFKEIEADLELVMEQKNAVLLYGPLPNIEGAPVLLYQLFYNLVNNSLKFAKQGVPPVITITSSTASGAELNEPALQQDAAYLKIVMQDNGIGFSQQNADLIFKTFTRLHSRDEFEGTGLGLALCKNIVTRHKGLITAQGSENKGASFVIILPQKQ